MNSAINEGAATLSSLNGEFSSELNDSLWNQPAELKPRRLYKAVDF